MLRKYIRNIMIMDKAGIMATLKGDYGATKHDHQNTEP